MTNFSRVRPSRPNTLSRIITSTHLSAGPPIAPRATGAGVNAVPPDTVNVVLNLASRPSTDLTVITALTVLMSLAASGVAFTASRMLGLPVRAVWAMPVVVLAYG